MRRRGLPSAWLLGLGLLLVAPQAVHADELDCTSTAGCTSTTGMVVEGQYWSFAGLLWSNTDAQTTGSGVADSFVRVGNSSSQGAVVQGMNSNYRPADENGSDTFSRDPALGEVPIFTIAGQQYYELLLDVSEQSSDPLFSLDGLELCTGTVGASYDLNGRIDTCADRRTGSETTLVPHGNSGDLLVYVPTSLLGVAPNTHVYLWSRFGLRDSGDGYEEWAVREGITPPPAPLVNLLPAVPEPASLLLLGTGLAIGGGLLRRSRRRARRQA